MLVPSAAGTSLTRAAIFAFATSVAACTSSRAPEPQAVQTIYGGPPAFMPQPAVDASATPTAPVEPVAVVAAYGAPSMMVVTPDASTAPDPVDASAPEVSTPDASRPDASRRADVARPQPPRDPGMMMVRYGAPPAGFA